MISRMKKLDNYVNTNLEDRDVELTNFLLRIFYTGQNIDAIKGTLAKMIYAKTYSKSNSIEAMIEMVN